MNATYRPSALIETSPELLFPWVPSEATLTRSIPSGLVAGVSAPSYTRPEEYRGYRVPEVLLSGHHAKIAEWRRDEGARRTGVKRA